MKSVQMHLSHPVVFYTLSCHNSSNVHARSVTFCFSQFSHFLACSRNLSPSLAFSPHFSHSLATSRNFSHSLASARIHNNHNNQQQRLVSLRHDHTVVREGGGGRKGGTRGGGGRAPYEAPVGCVPDRAAPSLGRSAPREVRTRASCLRETLPNGARRGGVTRVRARAPERGN